MKLISCTEFVLEQISRISIYHEDDADCLKYIENYANFLKQPLKLEIFVPCDDEGNVLEEPIDTIGGVEMYAKKYQQAKEKVLFDGFEKSSQKDAMRYGFKKSVDNYGKDSFYVTVKRSTGYHSYFQLPTIEDLVQCDLTLTQSALKQIGL